MNAKHTYTVTQVLFAACSWLAQRPMLRADARTLLAVCQDINRICRPWDTSTCWAVGELAAREVAQPTKPAKLMVLNQILNPEDLKD